MDSKFVVSILLLATIPFFNWCNKIYTDKILDKYSREVIQLIKETKNAKLFREKLNELEDMEFKRVINWMEANIGEFIPIYYIAMADDVFQFDEDKAVYWYYLGTIRSMQDSYMCQDASARKQFKKYPLYAPKTTEYMLENDKITKSLIIKALAWDMLNFKRTNPKWSCHFGNSHNLEIKPQEEYIKTQFEVRKMIFNSLKKRH